MERGVIILPQLFFWFFAVLVCGEREKKETRERERGEGSADCIQ